MDQYAQLRDAVLGATQQGSPTSPLGSFPELAQLYASSFQLPLSNVATKAQGFQTGVTDYNRRATDEEARANKIDELKAQYQAIQDASDPGKYQVVAREDGGYGFYDPGGKEISAFEYARISGKNPDEVLSKSQNPIDIGFRQDYKQLQDYLNAKANSKNDKKSATIAKNIEKTVKKNYGVDLSKMKIQDVIKRFQQAYPTVFGLKNKGVPVSQSFIPPKNTKQYDLGASGL